MLQAYRYCNCKSMLVYATALSDCGFDGFAIALKRNEKHKIGKVSQTTAGNHTVEYNMQHTRVSYA